MNTEHQLKSKLAWSVFQKSMKLKQKWYRSNGYSWKWYFYLFIGLNWLLVVGNKNLVGRGWMSKSLVGGTTPLFPQWGKPCINFASRFLYTMKNLHAHHIHHVPKWSSYFCKIWALCVSDICGIYFHMSVQCWWYNSFSH